MRTSTLTALKAVWEGDPPRTRAERDAAMRALGLAEEREPARPAERVVGFDEAARRLNRTPRGVHLLARRGLLRKAKVPGGVRAAGVLASDLEALLSGMRVPAGEGERMKDEGGRMKDEG